MAYQVAHLVCDLDEEAAAIPGGQLEPSGDALTQVSHPATAAHFHGLYREVAREAQDPVCVRGLPKPLF